MLKATSQMFSNDTSLEYYADGTMKKETLSIYGRNYPAAYKYDAANRKTSITYPNGSVVTRDYADRNQLQRVKLNQNQLVENIYDNGMRETTRKYGNGLERTQLWRKDNLLKRMSISGVQDHEYLYDADKRKLQETDFMMPNLNQAFAYDDEGRLVSWQSNAGSLPSTQSWALSKEGDWQSTTRDGVTESRAHNNAHEITSVAGAAVGHDPKGNLIQDPKGNKLNWTYSNLLKSVTMTDGKVHEYIYNAMNQRVAKKVGGVVTVYAVSGDQVLAEYSGNLLPASPSKVYVYGTYIDEPIAVVQNGGTYYYHANHLYSVSAITDRNGGMVEKYAYDAYGKVQIVVDKPGFEQPYTFTGRSLDKETGMMYFRARMYSVDLGRFVGRDPLGTALDINMMNALHFLKAGSGFSDGMSLYRAYFVVNGLDPSGSTWQSFTANVTFNIGMSLTVGAFFPGTYTPVGVTSIVVGAVVAAIINEVATLPPPPPPTTPTVPPPPFIPDTPCT